MDTVEIGVLGPITVNRDLGQPPPRAAVIEIAAFLALHPEHGWTADGLVEELSVETPRFKADTIRSYVTVLRRLLGNGHVPDGGPAGYTLTGVTTDWHRLHAAAVDVDATLDDLAAALALVRAAPFADVDPGTWEWVDRHSHGSLRSQIQQTITDLAARVAEQAIAAGDPDLALWATEQGLHATPDSDTLHRLALQAAALDADGDRLVRVWSAINRRLATVEETPSLALTTLYRGLHSGRSHSDPS